MNQRLELRSHLRQKRNQLSASQHNTAASNLAALVNSHQILKNIKNIALYIANDGEIDPLPIARQAWANNMMVYLPVLDPENSGHLLFYRWQHDSVMIKNKFGIPEPQTENICPANELDAVFLPLVGFDLNGNRLGMGGGYYDRTFAFKQSTDQRPQLIGLAHGCQQVDYLECESWDIPLDIILTDSQRYF